MTSVTWGGDVLHMTYRVLPSSLSRQRSVSLLPMSCSHLGGGRIRWNRSDLVRMDSNDESSSLVDKSLSSGCRVIVELQYLMITPLLVDILWSVEG